MLPTLSGDASSETVSFIAAAFYQYRQIILSTFIILNCHSPVPFLRTQINTDLGLNTLLTRFLFVDSQVELMCVKAIQFGIFSSIDTLNIGVHHYD